MFKRDDLNKMPLSELLYHHERSGIAFVIKDGQIAWAKWERKIYEKCKDQQSGN